MTPLAERLNSTGTTDAALASRVGCDRSMISKIRAGKAKPSLTLALAISRETGVPVEALVPVPAAACGADNNGAADDLCSDASAQAMP